MQVLMILALSIVGICQQKYTLFKTIENINGTYDRAVISNDMAIVLLYSPTIPTAVAFSALNWSSIASTTYSNFPFPPTSIETFTDFENQNILLYTSSLGEIRKRSYVAAGYIDGDLWEFNDTQYEIRRVLPSPDQALYAAFAYNSSYFYLGSLTVYIQEPQLIDLSANGTISSLRWRSTKSQLVISGGNFTGQPYFLLYNVLTKEQQNLSGLAQTMVTDTAFSSDGNTIYFIEENTDGSQQMIKSYNFVTKKNSSIVVSGASQLLQLAIKGNFLTAYDQAFVYIWNVKTQTFYGKYPSALKSIGLSFDGSELVSISSSPTAFSNSSTSLTVYKLCGDNEYYNPTSDSCELCTSPCLQCAFKPDHCSLCPNKTYLSPIFTCFPCISNCQKCQSNNWCYECTDTFYFNYTTIKCQLCSLSLIGCVSCYNVAQCKQCDTANNWQRTPQLQCICKERYLRVGQKCEQCPSNCLTCSSTTVCQTCDSANSWIVNPQGVCVCKGGSFADGSQCKACSSVMEGCLGCQNGTTCSSCSGQYNLNSATGQCELIEQNSNTVIIAVVVSVIGVAALGVAFFLIRRHLRNRRQSLLNSIPLISTE